MTLQQVLRCKLQRTLRQTKRKLPEYWPETNPGFTNIQAYLVMYLQSKTTSRRNCWCWRRFCRLECQWCSALGHNMFESRRQDNTVRSLLPACSSLKLSSTYHVETKGVSTSRDRSGTANNLRLYLYKQLAMQLSHLRCGHTCLFCQLGADGCHSYLTLHTDCKEFAGNGVKDR